MTPGATTADGGTGGFGTDGRPVAGKGSGGYVSFAPGKNPVGVKVAISYVDQKGATANLAVENPCGPHLRRRTTGRARRLAT